jgi:hypothetical protein
VPEDAAFKCIGLGGVGGPVARHLAVFLAASGRPARQVLIDGDHFEASNASRMVFGNFGNKAEVLADELLARLAESALTLAAINDFVTAENIHRLIREGDFVLLAVDNHVTRKLVSDHCATLRDVCLISGGNDGVERDRDGRQRRGTFGNVQVFVRRGGADVTPALTAAHPEIARPADRHPADKSCTELVASVPQILFTNLTVAAAMLNTLWLELSGVRPYAELVFDIAEGLMRPISVDSIPTGGGAVADKGR